MHFQQLRVCVAKLVLQCAHRAFDLDSRRIDADIDEVVQRGVGRWREVEDCVRTADGVLAVLGVLVLPDPPCTVDLGVVEEEVGVTRGGIEIAARVAADPEVAAGMHTEVFVRKVTLHPVLEADDVGAVGDQFIFGRIS